MSFLNKLLNREVLTKKSGQSNYSPVESQPINELIQTTQIIPKLNFPEFSSNSSLGSNYIISPASEYSTLDIFRPLLSENGYIAGGAFKNIFNGEPAKDIDLFFTTGSYVTKAITMFRDLCKRENSHYMEEYETDRSTGFRNIKSGILIDVIRYRAGTPAEVLDTFDFNVAKFAFFRNNGEYKVMYHPDFFEDLKNRMIRIPETYFSSSWCDGNKLFDRVIRYTRYGFDFDDNLKEHLFNAIKGTSKTDKFDLGS